MPELRRSRRAGVVRDDGVDVHAATAERYAKIFGGEVVAVEYEPPVYNTMPRDKRT